MPQWNIANLSAIITNEVQELAPQWTNTDWISGIQAIHVNQNNNQNVAMSTNSGDFTHLQNTLQDFSKQSANILTDQSVDGPLHSEVTQELAEQSADGPTYTELVTCPPNHPDKLYHVLRFSGLPHDSPIPPSTQSQAHDEPCQQEEDPSTPHQQNNGGGFGSLIG